MPIVLVFWRWYYGEAVKNVLTAWRNFIIFAVNYFSIPLLFKTLLAPWKRDITKKPHGLDFKKFFEYIVFNAISRGVGFVVRVFTIIAGIIYFILTIALGVMFFILWLILPFIILGLLIFAIILLFQSFG
jgi:hypothetical protein